MKTSSKKAQASISEGPAIVLTVGFVFLIMATISYVNIKYNDSFESDTYTIVNETFSSVDEVGEASSAVSATCGFADFSVSACLNQSTDAGVIDTGMYTYQATSGIILFTGGTNVTYNNTDWNCTYSYTGKGTECNITTDLSEEILNNTSMVGMILTISIVAIILGVLISIFVGSRRGIQGGPAV